ncbi:MAG: hypothetical protein NVS9B10_14590 [Nevskia sp.]
MLPPRHGWREELDWHRRLRHRAAALWQFKTLSACVIAFTFFAGYFALLDHPQFAVTPMPVTWLDGVVDFAPGSLLLYVTLWLYISLPPGLLDTRADLLRYYAGIAGLALAGMAVFLFWPTASPRPDIDWTQYPVFGPLLAVDRSGNAFPSLHAAFAVFTAIWFDRFLRHPGDRGFARALNWLWSLGILYSTLATKQHVAVDMFGGIVVGVVAALIHGRWLRLPPRYPERSR